MNQLESYGVVHIFYTKHITLAQKVSDVFIYDKKTDFGKDCFYA